MPKFSIVIPTRNRSALLRYSLQSALDQQYKDLEIIVSDNYSSDGTAGLLQQFCDDRLKYIRTDEALSMPDSWEFALSHASGDYVIFLCDDDAMNPRLIDTVAQVIGRQRYDVICWRRHAYTHPSWYQPERRNVLSYKPCSKRVIEMDSRQALVALCTGLSSSQGDFGPLMLNSACTRRVIESVRRRIGRFFLPPAPDFSTYVAVLATVDRYAFIDDLLMLGGSGKESIGASSTYRKETEAISNYIKEFKGQKIINYAPLMPLVGANAVAETFLTVKHAMPKELAGIDINWENYFIACYEQMLAWQQNGSDMSSGFKEFWTVLGGYPADFQKRVRAAIRGAKAKLVLHRYLHTMVNLNGALGGFVYSVLYRLSRKARSIPIRGETGGFANILECARQLDAIAERFN